MFHETVEGIRFSGNQLPREFNFGVSFQSPYRFSL
jgi:hypothetical protein